MPETDQPKFRRQVGQVRLTGICGQPVEFGVGLPERQAKNAAAGYRHTTVHEEIGFVDRQRGRQHARQWHRRSRCWRKLRVDGQYASPPTRSGGTNTEAFAPVGWPSADHDGRSFPPNAVRLRAKRHYRIGERSPER